MGWLKNYDGSLFSIHFRVWSCEKTILKKIDVKECCHILLNLASPQFFSWGKKLSCSCLVESFRYLETEDTHILRRHGSYALMWDWIRQLCLGNKELLRKFTHSLQKRKYLRINNLLSLLMNGKMYPVKSCFMERRATNAFRECIMRTSRERQGKKHVDCDEGRVRPLAAIRKSSAKHNRDELPCILRTMYSSINFHSYFLQDFSRIYSHRCNCCQGLYLWSETLTHAAKQGRKFLFAIILRSAGYYAPILITTRELIAGIANHTNYLIIIVLTIVATYLMSQIEIYGCKYAYKELVVTFFFLYV